MCGSASTSRRNVVSRQRRRSSTSLTVIGCSRSRSAPVNSAGPLLEERCDPLREVVGLRHLGLRDRLELELLGEGRLLRGVEQALRVPDRARRHRGEELGHLVCAVLELVGRHDFRDEAPRPCLLRAEPAAGRQPLERAGGAEQAAHEPGAAGVRDEADVDERRHEARAVGGDAHVARKRQRHAGAGGRAVDRCDHGLLERPDREHVAVVVLPQILGHVARAARELLQVLADAEAAPGAGDHHGADRRILGVTQCGLDPTCIAPLSAFSTSGRLSVIVKTAPSRETSTSAIAQDLNRTRVRPVNNAYDAFPSLELDRPAPHVLRLTLRAPGQLNAVSGTMHRELAAVWRTIGDDDETRAVLVRGADGVVQRRRRPRPRARDRERPRDPATRLPRGARPRLQRDRLPEADRLGDDGPRGRRRARRRAARRHLDRDTRTHGSSTGTRSSASRPATMPRSSGRCSAGWRRRSTTCCSASPSTASRQSASGSSRSACPRTSSRSARSRSRRGSRQARNRRSGTRSSP